MLSKRTRANLCVAVFILTFCVLCSYSQTGGNVNILFEELDASGPESNSVVTAPVRVQGDNTENFTVIATPLTAAQYKADPSAYGNNCDSIITDNSVDPAEESDFDGTQVEVLVPSDATDALGRYEINIPISVENDDIQEPTEYFLLVLDAHQSPATDLIRFTRGRQCIRVKITQDQDAITLDYEPLVRLVNEGAGTVEVLRVVKNGQTEQPVQISFSGGVSNTFIISPTTITLQPDVTTAIVSITVIDDLLPENDLSSIISADSISGSEQINIVILDNDHVTIGFDQTEVTVIEGETLSLTTSVKNNGLTIAEYLRSDLFEISTLQGTGNATAPRHYRSQVIPFYFPGDPIKIPTVDDNILERSRQFEVRIANLSSNPLNILEPSRVIVTIRDNDGIPNKPTTTSLTLTENNITVNWMIDRHELRPVHTYMIQFQVTRSDDQDLNSGSELETSGDNQTITEVAGANFGGNSILTEGLEINVTVSVAELNCNANTRDDIDHCEYILTQDTEIGQTYSIIVCALNDFGTTCGEAKNITATPVTTSVPSMDTTVSNTLPQSTPTSITTLTPQGTVTVAPSSTLAPHGTLTLPTTLTPLQITTTVTLPPSVGPKTPTRLEGVIVGIVFAVIVAVLLCCMLSVLIILLCLWCCLKRSREKNYWPEKKEKENQAGLEKYRKERLSESSDLSEDMTLYV